MTHGIAKRMPPILKACCHFDGGFGAASDRERAAIRWRAFAQYADLKLFRSSTLARLWHRYRRAHRPASIMGPGFCRSLDLGCLRSGSWIISKRKTGCSVIFERLLFVCAVAESFAISRVLSSKIDKVKAKRLIDVTTSSSNQRQQAAVKLVNML